MVMSWLHRSAAPILALPILLALMNAPVFATTRIYSLYGDSLFGPADSFTSMRSMALNHRDRLLVAAEISGLDHRERAALLHDLRDGNATWTVIPRRLDSMTWYRRGTVRIFRDVVIPAGQWGWEIDVPSARGNLALFLPDTCGNLSVIRTPIMTARGSGAVPWVHYVHVPPAPLQAQPTFMAAHPAVTAIVPEQPAVPQVLAATTSRRGAFPWWLFPILIFIPHGGGSTPGTPYTPPPTPPPSFYQCWEGPVPLCDSAQARSGPHARLSIRLQIPGF
jgi:hypothetical protein